MVRSGEGRRRVRSLAENLKTLIFRGWYCVEIWLRMVCNQEIAFIHCQCTLFAAPREARLPGMDLGRRHLSTDRQDYVVNWGNRANRKTIQLTAVATVDRESGYVLAFSPNFDASLDQDEVEAAWRDAGDANKPPQMRDTARVWTNADYEASLARAAARPVPALR